MADIGGSSSDDESKASKWLKREQKLFDEIADTNKNYSQQIRVSARWQRITAVSAMICSVLSPVLVAAATNHSTTTISALSVCAIVVATIGALIEGIRRIYRFEQRWATLNAAKRAIFSARETYRAKSIDLAMGSTEWQVIYYDFKNAYENATSQQASIFFKGLTSPGDGGSKSEDEKHHDT